MAISNEEARKIFFTQSISIIRNRQVDGGNFRACLRQSAGKDTLVPIDISVGTKEEILQSISKWLDTL